MEDHDQEQPSVTRSHSPTARESRILDRLPNEMFAHILEYLSNDDLYNLPSIFLDKGLLWTEGIRRFGTLFVCIERPSLVRLSRISHHRNFSKYVKELIFHMAVPCKPDLEIFIEEQWEIHWRELQWYESVIPRELNLQNFHHWRWVFHDGSSQFALRPQEKSEGHRCQMGSCRDWPSVEAHFLAMKATFEDYLKLKADGTDVAMLIDSFANLTNAETLTIDNVIRDGEELRALRAAPFATAERSETRTRNYRGDHGTYLFTPLIKALAASPRKPNVLRVIDGREYIDSDECRCQRAISFGDLHRTLPASTYPAAFGQMKKLDFRDLRLTAIDWTPPLSSIYDGREVGPSDSWIGPLESIIKSAVSLEELAIGTGQGSIGVESDTDYGLREDHKLHIPLSRLLGNGDVFDGGEFKSLRILTLSDFFTSEQHLVDSLWACAPTLANLVLGKIELTSGTWRQAFKLLQGGFSLKYVELGALSMRGEQCNEETGYGGQCNVIWTKDAGDMVLKLLCGDRDEDDISWKWLCGVDAVHALRFRPNQDMRVRRNVPNMVGRA